MPLNRDRIVPYPTNIDYTKQSIEVPGTRRPGQTGHYRNALWPMLSENSPGTFLTLDAIFKDGLKAGRDRECLGHRPIISTDPLKFANRYIWQTYGQVDDRRRYIGSTLSSFFRDGELGGGDYPTVGIWSQNRPEWQIIDVALASYGFVSVSLYETLGKDSVEYIIKHAHLTVVFTTASHIPTLIKLASSAKMLKMIVSIDDLSAETSLILKEWCQSQDLQLKELREIEALGKANLTEPVPATPEQLVSICYTSGTTSTPKGVLLTHKNLAMATHSSLYGLNLPDEGSTMSYLPLAHIYERIVELCALATGAKIGFSTGDPLRLIEDAQILKPNFFPSVPRVLNRVYQAAMLAGDAPGLRGMIFKKAVAAKLERLHATGDNVNALWDRIVFGKIHAVLGGQLKHVVCGSAPISADVMDFLKIAFSCEVVEGEFLICSASSTLNLLGYGLTETCAVVARSIPGDPSSSGTVGPPQAIAEVKLLDVPSMNYTSEDKPRPRGELLVRGSQCFLTYYKDKENTKSTVGAEGWIHTGDVAEIDECGRIKIIDRVKNIMKLAQGEYVALEKIENTYASCPAVAQIYVHGDSLQPFLLAVVVPETTYLASIASELSGKKITGNDLPDLVRACKDEKVNRRIMDSLANEGKKNGLKGFEMVKRIHLSLDPFTVEDGTLTPTLKIRRKDAFKKFEKELAALYSLGVPKL